jgi:hypothetical protein
VSDPADGVQRLELASGVRTSSSTPMRPALWYVAFDPGSDGRGYASAYRAYQVTDDGGRSWQRHEQPAQLGQLFPVGGAVVWATADSACNDCPTLYLSTDGGSSWSGRDGPWSFISSLQPADNERAWVVADNGLWRTDDGGMNWVKLQDGNSAGYYRFVGRSFGYTLTCGIYNCSDSFRVSHDGGETWETRPLPLSDGLTFVTPEIGFAMRFEGIQDCPCTFPLMRTGDGGRTWRDVVRFPSHLGNFTFVDELRGWAIGGGSDPTRNYVYRTADGGYSWGAELTLPPNTYAQELSVHGDRITLHAGLGVGQGLVDRTFLFERAIEPPRTKPIISPNTGMGEGSTLSPSIVWVALAFGLLAMIAGVLLRVASLGAAAWDTRYDQTV